MRLIRIASIEAGTFGVLVYKEVPFCVTLENPWKDNIPYISCIPEGSYHCNRVQSPRFGDTFEVINVKDRTSILFHAGNIEADTSGCILLAMSYGMLHDIPAITNSRVAMSKFKETLKDAEGFSLIIQDKNSGPSVIAVNDPLAESPIG